MYELRLLARTVYEFKDELENERELKEIASSRFVRCTETEKEEYKKQLQKSKSV